MLVTASWKYLSSGNLEPLPLRDAAWPLQAIPAELEQTIVFDEGPVYAVVDAAKVFGLAEVLQASGLRYRCLYRGRSEDEWGDVAPWLVQLDPNHRLTRKFFVEGNDQGSLSFQRATSLFFMGSDDFDAVWSHLRKFTKMRAEDGRVLMLRFYDPLTFADLLEVMPRAQVAQLHGDLRALCIQADGRWTCTEAVSC